MHTIIPNHIVSKLSELDMRIIKSVPPGGNWKNIPIDIPSKRLEQIRASFAAGKGSRSTYYGRLLPNKPSYTINTYFNRPGNGCHIHYNQDRVLSQREAARLQSFPDNFIFYGSQSSINTQIGNAVPPLLAYQIATQISKIIGKTGIFVDLFAGAGGLALGFKWAGWQPIIANDIDPVFLKTYANNIHKNILAGSITDKSIFQKIVEETMEAKLHKTNSPLFILGGPPCQGFSTAGNKRTMEDERNHLFEDYVKFLRLVKPDGFVFENVAGLLNMEKGEIFKKVKKAFLEEIPYIKGTVLNSENYAIPQRRKRVFLLGFQNVEPDNIKFPPELTSLIEANNYQKSISVEEALSDLPELQPAQDGSFFQYRTHAETRYQMLMRGEITPMEFLSLYK